MAEAIQDKHVVAVLRPLVRASAPVLATLRESDPLGLVRRALPAKDAEPVEPEPDELKDVDRTLREKLLDGLESVKVPGTAAWHEMTLDDRVSWWVGRVGRFTALVAAVPGIGGALADRLPLQDTLGAAGQGVLLCAIATEYGLTEQADQVRLLAAVLFDREIDPELAAGKGDGRSAEEEDAATAELTEELTESKGKHGKVTFKAIAKTLWRFGRALLGIQDELGKRPQGRFYHRALGKLPVVGIAGDYLGERSALKRATKAAQKWIAADRAKA